MQRSVLWSSDDGGFVVLVRHGVHVVGLYRAEGLGGSPVEMRAQAAAKAIELALEHRIELRNVTESPAAMD